MTDLHHLECVDPVVPISRAIKRMEAHYDQLHMSLMLTPWWYYKRRWILSGACATYRNEIDALLTLSASCQPVIGDMMRKRKL